MSTTLLDARGVRLRRGSGGGKTTLLRAVAGLDAFDAGTLVVDGVDLPAGGRPGREAARALRRKVGMVFQFHYLFEHMTALHNVWLAPVHVHRVPKGEAEAKAQALLDQLGVGARAGALPRELSGGEAQRVAIARALAVDPLLLLMDEPTASLDPARRDELGETLRRLTAAGRALVAATHDDDFVRDFADRVVVMAHGQVVEQGPPSSVLTDPQHSATRQLLSQKKYDTEKERSR
jgi:polar amino acid transport system ATP-binding protein